jgi:DtxR family Mn-dependent transcriptional regulator
VALKYSISEENYIKTIYHLQKDDEPVTTNELATALKAKPASITDMMKKLKAKKLLHYQPYQGFKLSAEGNKVALVIIRRHRLWEYFLSEKLKFAWDEVHDVAEQLEHVSSKKLIDKLDEFLNFPRTDPHGDPIPDANGKMETTEKVCLADLPLHTMVKVCGVNDHSSDVLDLLEHKGIHLGCRIEVKKRFAYDQSMEIKISNLPVDSISEQLAKKIFVVYDSTSK